MLLRKTFFVAIAFALSALAGCVWPSDSIQTGYFGDNYGSVSYTVHWLSSLSAAGTESISVQITPTPVQPYSTTYDPDSIRYIIVNGDTAYRHPVYTLPPVLDSSAPYHIDGSVNFVTIVSQSFSLVDTTYESNFDPIITSPPVSDSLSRDSDLLFGFITGNSYEVPGTFQITDSGLFYSQSIDEFESGTADFPVSEVETLHRGIIWADLQFIVSSQDNFYYIPQVNFGGVELQHQLIMDRKIAYFLQ